MKTFIFALCVVLILGGIWISASQSAPKPNAVRDFMRPKLDHAKQVLEGLTLEDFDQIARHSQAMSLLSQDSNWQVLQTTEYLERSQEFHRAADALTNAARNKNLDGAALAYVDLTMKCIQCHQYVRDLPPAAPDRPKK